jgi:hypothetical protein
MMAVRPTRMYAHEYIPRYLLLFLVTNRQRANNAHTEWYLLNFAMTRTLMNVYIGIPTYSLNLAND